MTDQRPNRTAHDASRWLIVFFLGAIAACLLAAVGAGAIPALAQDGGGVTSGAGGNLFAVAGPLTRTTYGMYLVDSRNGTLCVYEYEPANKKLYLRAARNVAFDLQLDAYNTEISPHQVKTLVEQNRRLKTTGQ
ncbi:MAG: hypothetical protein ABFD92_08555 [Planctomycetaceae bacterium]|nr:hypothetical protein [Planctomycetaceae bacterium]